MLFQKAVGNDIYTEWNKRMKRWETSVTLLEKTG